MTAPGLAATNADTWALASHWGASRYMTPFEALMWRVEADPRLRSTMTVVYLLDRTPDWDRLVAAHEWASRLIPRARQRVVEPPLGLGAPTWVVDDQFDLRFHLRRGGLPEPGTMRELLDLAAADAMASFDRTRPPWRAALVEGLEDGRAAYVLKLHHSLTDGQGATQLVGLLHSHTREPSPGKPLQEPPAAEPTSPLAVLAEQAAANARSAPAGVARRAAGALGTASRFATRPTDGLADGARFAPAPPGGCATRRAFPPPPAPPPPPPPRPPLPSPRRPQPLLALRRARRAA